jgi:hypothetical protein
MQALRTRLQQQFERIPLHRLGALSTHPRFTMIVAGLIGGLAVVIFLSFFATTWYSLGDFSKTGVAVMLGIGDGPFGRVIDLLLVIIPLGGITQLALAVMAARGALPLNHALASMTLVALTVLVVPLVWQGMSNNAFDDMIRDEASSGYQTALHFWLSFLLLSVSVAASALYFGHHLRLFPEATVPEAPADQPSEENPSPASSASETADPATNGGVNS